MELDRMGKDHMIYRPEHDRSEEFGWTKVSEQHEPSQEEQERWSKISVIAAMLLSCKTLIITGLE